MSTDPADDPRSTAVEQLERLGLSAYAARTFVALTSLETGTAKDVSEVSEVPRTRVYDAIDELHDRGLVDVRHSSPKTFWAISTETATRKFAQEMDHRVSVLTAALNEIEPTQRTREQRGVWTVDGRVPITDRVIELVSDAEDEVVYMTVEDLLDEAIVDALRAAADRGVRIRLGSVSSAVRAQIQDDVPGAETFDSLWLWSDTPAGRLMMVDETRTLVSVLVGTDDADPTDRRSETAIWGSGEMNSLVVVLKTIFTWQLDQ
ncbi:TrmB family transcriptional regulator [Halorubrum rubrum]|uniref:TrmB family transcriptional regulator n=1 Tax=Halorubrum rubrum TaxID=1126240 RepID=A0ABD5QYR1_9EURY|nr:helix-turn-helix domain-containing protein [Halorubrum rubrum]